MKLTASRMCCSGDEHLVPVEHEDMTSNVTMTATTSTTTTSANINTGDSVEPSSPMASDSTLINSQNTKIPLKHPVQRPVKSYNQREKECIENLEALTDLDEADWLEAVALLEMAHTQQILNHEERRALVIIDEYYESLREDHARRDASRNAEHRAERQRAAFFADSIHRFK